MSIKNFALIIGAMKCGTTSLFYYLSEHPEIAPIEDKEPHFFAYENRFNRGLDWYVNQWDWQPEHRIALEASTTYTMYPKYHDVPQRIASVGGDFKFIYIMRDPFKRIESHMRHLLSGGHQKQPKIIDEHLAFTEYARQIQPYVELFGRHRLHLMTLEDLRSNPKVELQKVCQFLDIDPNYEFASLNVVRNSKKTLNLNPTVRQIYQIPAVKSLASNLVSPSIRQKFYTVFSRKDPYEIKLSDPDKELIVKRLAPDLLRLQQNYGIDVQNQWNLPQLAEQRQATD